MYAIGDWVVAPGLGDDKPARVAEVYPDSFGEPRYRVQFSEEASVAGLYHSELWRYVDVPADLQPATVEAWLVS
jgi:hypothetical protein